MKLIKLSYANGTTILARVPVRWERAMSVDIIAGLEAKRCKMSVSHEPWEGTPGTWLCTERFSLTYYSERLVPIDFYDLPGEAL